MAPANILQFVSVNFIVNCNRILYEINYLRFQITEVICSNNKRGGSIKVKFLFKSVAPPIDMILRNYIFISDCKHNAAILKQQST